MSAPDPTVRLIEHPTEADRKPIFEGLLAYNAGFIPNENYMPLAVVVERADGSAGGGLVGSVYWNALFVELFWVAEDLRGDGVGSAIMAQAEAYARGRGCDLIHLDTMSFQARGFYEKLGFAVIGTMTGYPDGIERYYLVKHLTQAPQ